MTESDIHNFLSLFPDSLMKLSKEEQDLSIALYRQLAKGQPVSSEVLAESVTEPSADVLAIINQWGSEVHRNNDGNMVGFFGLSLNRTAHSLEVNGQLLYTWCAWDTLFIPALLNQTVEINSTCPVTSQAIALEVSPSGILSAQPATAVVSLISPDPEKISENVTGTFCCHIHFFASKEVGEAWSEKNTGTSIVSLEDAYHLGRRKNELRYPNVFAST